MAYIRQIGVADADGKLKRVFDSAIQRAGYVAGIIRIMSLDADVIAASMQFYVTLMKSENVLGRATRELLATVVSNVNDCFY